MSGDTGATATRWQRAARRNRDVRLGMRASAGAFVATAALCTHVAADRTVPALDVAIVLTTLVALAAPDTHLGLVPLALLVVDWGVSVDDPASPWAIGVAVSVTGLHSSLAAYGVAPPGAAWTTTMRRRWYRRTAIATAASVPMWSVVAALTATDVPTSPVLVTVALVVLATWARWARDGRHLPIGDGAAQPRGPTPNA